MTGDGVERSLGRLEEGLKRVTEDVQGFRKESNQREEKSSEYRASIREQLGGIDDKIDPIKVEITSLTLETKANVAAIASLDHRLTPLEEIYRSMQTGAKIGKWMFKWLWAMIGTAILTAIAWMVGLFHIGPK